MSTPSVLNLLPSYFAKRAERIRELRRIGMSFYGALRCAAGINAWSRFLEARLNLLPDGFANKVGTVVDVGANRGDWSEIALYVLNPKRLIAIEPNPATHAGLSQRFKDCAAVTCLNLGASAESAELPFHITMGSQCASFLKPVSSMHAIYGDAFIEDKTIVVRVESLDTILKDCATISLLKIDVQGYEREVLAGARETLQKTTYVLIEVNFAQHYNNDVQFFELEQIMASHGFVLANISQAFVRQERVLWADALYRKADPLDILRD